MVKQDNTSGNNDDLAQLREQRKNATGDQAADLDSRISAAEQRQSGAAGEQRAPEQR